jgi:hypothetical protein
MEAVEKRGIDMNTRFINFEGIHGSGKSAGAWNLSNSLNQHNVDTEVYFEYHMDSTLENPCDIRKTAVMDKEQFAGFIREHGANEALLRDKVTTCDDWHFLFMPEVKDAPELSAALAPFVADNGNLSTEIFMQALKSRWSAFVEQALVTDKVYVFENVLFQQVFNELMRTMACSEQQMLAYVTELEQILAPLHPVFFYLVPDDLTKQIERVAAQRVSDNLELYPDWIDWMVDYVRNSAYGKERKVENREGLLIYFQERAALEEKGYQQLTCFKAIIPIDQMDYPQINAVVYQKVEQWLGR